jgi:hypothetical protein
MLKIATILYQPLKSKGWYMTAPTWKVVVCNVHGLSPRFANSDTCEKPTRLRNCTIVCGGAVEYNNASKD